MLVFEAADDILVEISKFFIDILHIQIKQHKNKCTVQQIMFPYYCFNCQL